jgi:hypothetical protein
MRGFVSHTAGDAMFPQSNDFARLFFCTGCLIVLLGRAASVSAQELEPRSYSASPVGTNFFGATYTYLSGDVLTDPSLPISDIQAHINILTLGYLRTFAIAGRSASLGFGMPFARGNVSGNVFDAPHEVYRAGLGDLRLRFALALLGDPALTPAEFASRVPTTSIGVSLTMIAPTGQYVPSHLINVGTNRWAFKPEIGISQPIGKWFVETSGGVWFYTDNNDFLGGNKRSERPLAVVQLHAGYQFRTSLWVSADIGYYAGGRTAVNGVPNDDARSNTRYGLTFSAPLARGWSAKLALSQGLVTRAGGDYKSVSLTLQYRWFDH